ncbi:MAG: sigma-54-dependent Fis family transcriptional regulator [Candidatus Latescibacterota bacterium]|nr:MAG: sigma-54-dependent Fis family transcriptional regulator [Candidatus Latescibacterota bacterium]
MTDGNLHLLGVTNDPTISQVLHELDSSDGWSVVLYRDSARVFSTSIERIHLLLLDETVTGANYLSIVRRARRRFPEADIVVVGGPKSDDVRVGDKREGVDYYFERPIEADQFRLAMGHRLKMSALRTAAGIVGRSLQIEEILEAILQVAPTEVPILIEGESGTGKDVIARAIHFASRRSAEPYVAINCASLAEGVLESELFGHERGSFTGAVAQRSGVFERANKGTIFLDEVGEMSPNMQVRLLRVLESGEILRVGGVKSFRVDVRVIAATNRSLSRAVQDGRFRQDLYYRLKGVNFHLPPLRDRKDDIPVLTDYFLREANVKHGKSVRAIEKDGLRRLMGYHWPGNIRELRNVVETAVVLAPTGRITPELIETQLGDAASAEGNLLPVPLHRSKDEAEREMIYGSILAMHRDVREILALIRQAAEGEPLGTMKEVFPEGAEPVQEGVQTLSNLERTAIQEALRASDGNRRKAAELLGISERTLYRKIKEYGLV